MSVVGREGGLELRLRNLIVVGWKAQAKGVVYSEKGEGTYLGDSQTSLA